MKANTIIDFHCHIFPPEIISKRESYQRKDRAFELLYQNPKAKLVTAEELVTNMTSEGITKSVVFGFPWKDSEIYRLHNDYVIESIRKFPDKLIGFVCFLPSEDSNLVENEIFRCLDLGLSGIGEISWYLGDISEIVKHLTGVMEIAKGKDVPVLIHTNEPIGPNYPGKTNMTINGIHKIVETYNQNKIVLAHWGGGIFFYQLLKKDIRSLYENVWFDTAASPYLYTKEIYKIAVEILGPQKIVFGSDYPLISPSRYIREMEEAGLSEEQLSQLLYKNAYRLLKGGI